MKYIQSILFLFVIESARMLWVFSYAIREKHDCLSLNIDVVYVVIQRLIFVSKTTKIDEMTLADVIFVVIYNDIQDVLFST